MTVDYRNSSAEDGLTLGEIDLYYQIMGYRFSLGLPALPLSHALTTVAARHVVDLVDNVVSYPLDTVAGQNRAHGWSDATYDGTNPATYISMTDAPQRLATGYPGSGYEIVAAAYAGQNRVMRDADIGAAQALSIWQGSPGDNALLANTGAWTGVGWNAVGIALYHGAAAVWFGSEIDPTGSVPVVDFEPLRYLASYKDLSDAFGTDNDAAVLHYFNAGAQEGRDPTLFAPYQYLASNPDLAAAFGMDVEASERHYISLGRAEGRTTTGFDVDGYLAGNIDLFWVFGTDREAAARHWLTFGRSEGRVTTGFDALAYEQANPDVAAAFGSDLRAATRHYVDHGYAEGRPTSPDMAAAAGVAIRTGPGADPARTAMLAAG